MKGKLTKKEQIVMKKTHRDIGWLLAPPPTPEIMNHEPWRKGGEAGEDEVENSRMESTV